MRLIVTNGDAAVERLRAGGMTGDILPWRDVLHDGPVPEDEPLERLSQLRAAFLAEEFGMPRDELALRFVERDTTIRQHRDYDRIEIWLEHDLYDQLQLLQILHFFAEQQRMENIYLVQADSYLGLTRVEDVETLSRTAKRVSAMQFELACHGWRAFTSPDPSALAQFSSHDTGALPFLKPAILRLLAEFPDPVRGLSLTEERILERLQDGPATASDLFREVTGQEDARFMADASFFRRVGGLAFVKEPLLNGLSAPYCLRSEKLDAADGLPASYAEFAGAEVRLTDAGREVLSGGLDHAMANDVDRWIGGVRLRPALQLRYDRKAGEMIAPR
jgi:hypothetical protein